jgi:hypothetical protein
MFNIISNLPGILVLLVIGLFIYRKLNKKKPVPVNLNETIARKSTSSETQSENGETLYEGNTGGVSWTLKSIVIRHSAASRTVTSNRVWKRKSMWKTDSVKFPVGKFIMLMSTPGEIKTSEIKRGGFINTLINKAADAALDIYVAGYFGSEYCSLVGIGEDGVKVEREQLKDFMILTNDAATAEKYFDESTVSTIANWKQSNQAFKRENKVDQFGLLFSPDGVILSCQTNMTTTEEVKAFSDFGSVLTIKMKEILSTH